MFSYFTLILDEDDDDDDDDDGGKKTRNNNKYNIISQPADVVSDYHEKRTKCRVDLDSCCTWFLP